MGAERHNFGTDAAESLLGWWRDAGVDCVVGDVPHRWLAVPGAARGAAKVPEPVAVPIVQQRALPDTLAAFRDWLMTGDVPEAGLPSRRLAPAGDPASGLMILTDVPDRTDLDAGQWFAEPLDGLFTMMLKALGRDRSLVYVAPLCPGRPATGRIGDDSLAELARIARHHIALVAPAQLWLMGTAPSRAILGMPDADAKGRLHAVNLTSVTVKTIATAHPRTFEGSKARKGAAWTEMQRLIDRPTEGDMTA